MKPAHGATKGEIMDGGTKPGDAGRESVEQLEERLELEEACAALARPLAQALPEGVGFALLLFDFGSGGNMAYVSNANREDMLAAQQEMIAKLGGSAS